ncbi:MAG TPA: electron transfer flavoprotein subunit alpha/FixB family protein [candidate division Zixibacteria bacterium]|nr:electron transfer flavoprotein subunit alpha/FixB family protein [candidate division Zixibacteria bacterium]
MKTLIVAELREGKLSSTAAELFTFAQTLGASEIAAIVLGENVEEAAQTLGQLGAKAIYAFSDSKLKFFVDEVFAALVSKVVDEANPDLILGAASFTGKALFPRLAANFKFPLVTDVSKVESNPPPIVVRPSYGGNVYQKIKIEKTPVLLTVRPKSFPAAKLDSSKNGEVKAGAVDWSALIAHTNVLEKVKEEAQTVNLGDADIIVSGGRGLREPANFTLVRELAAAVGGAVGASRAVVDAGWIPYAHQVGQTGRTVNPKLYFACGISGAIQHLVGMQSSGIIVALNRDKDAPIFGVATYGIVSDLFEIIPALTKVFKEKLGR